MPALRHELGTEDCGCLTASVFHQFKEVVPGRRRGSEGIHRGLQGEVFETASLPAGISPVSLPLPVR